MKILSLASEHSEKHFFIKLDMPPALRTKLSPIDDIFFYVPIGHFYHARAIHSALKDDYVDSFSLFFSREIQVFFQSAFDLHFSDHRRTSTGSSFSQLLLNKAGQLFQKKAMIVTPEDSRYVSIDERFFLKLHTQHHPQKRHIAACSLDLKSLHPQIDIDLFLIFLAQFCRSNDIGLDLKVSQPITEEDRRTLSEHPSVIQYKELLDAFTHHPTLNKRFLHPYTPKDIKDTQTSNTQPSNFEDVAVMTVPDVPVLSSDVINQDTPQIINPSSNSISKPLKRKIIRF